MMMLSNFNLVIGSQLPGEHFVSPHSSSSHKDVQNMTTIADNPTLLQTFYNDLSYSINRSFDYMLSPDSHIVLITISKVH